MYADTIHHDEDIAITELFVGRKIVSAERDTLTLDDGTRVEVRPNEGGCSCGAGDYSLESLATTPNVITRAEVEEIDDRGEDDYREDPKSYRLYVWAENKQITALQVDGDDGNGYYGTGFELRVTRSTIEAP